MIVSLEMFIEKGKEGYIGCTMHGYLGPEASRRQGDFVCYPRHRDFIILAVNRNGHPDVCPIPSGSVVIVALVDGNWNTVYLSIW